MPGNGSAPSEGDILKVLAESAGIPELQAFEEDSGELEVATDELRNKLEAIDIADELLDGPFFGDEDAEGEIDKTLH